MQVGAIDPEDHAAATNGARRPLILVVDDDPGFLRSCARLLDGWGYSVETALEGSEALRRTRQTTYDVILSDINVPDLNGLEFIQKAWSLRPALRVVMITAHGTREVINRATQTGVSSVVLKPFTPTELTRGVTEAAGDPTRG